MKTLLTFLAGFIMGAFVLYTFLWYQVFNVAIDTWCQIYSGPPSVHMHEACKDR